ncbi:NUDIX domain-containing protein [Brevundimonas sp.]|uniref:NUDIX domain-containing protein n=1 Tax=Brevundimonas sp. TaxID=1871086 RepID=UPI003BA8EF98
MAEKSHCYDWPRPAVTTDIVVLREAQVLLIRRAHPPFAGSWALPGGFLDEDETLEVCAARELLEETGVAADTLRLVGTYSEPKRDPRHRTVTVAFLTRAPAGTEAKAGDDAAEAAWFALDALPPLAFDHADILQDALKMA